MAPEVLKQEAYGVEVDLWAIGVILHVMHFGRWPYMPTEPGVPAMTAAILDGHPAPSFRPHAGGPRLSRECTGLARALLRRDPDERLSAERALGHGWFRARAEGGLEEEESLRPMILEARRLGAFSSGDTSAEPTELDLLMQRLNSQHHAAASQPSSTCGHRARNPSEISTDAGSEGN